MTHDINSVYLFALANLRPVRGLGKGVSLLLP